MSIIMEIDDRNKWLQNNSHNIMYYLKCLCRTILLRTDPCFVDYGGKEDKTLNRKL